MSATTEKLEFKTELKQLLHLIAHSLYSNREIFLRELISNASDAINKLKFNSLDRDDLFGDDKDWKITIRPDKDAGTLTISDNGIGLTRDQAIDQLGTIAKSGTRAFLESLKQAEGKSKPELIGQFGVGFYSAFMVADKVTVVSRPAGQPDAGVRWESDGEGEFTVEPATRDRRGTDVILHLKDDAKEFLDEWRLRAVAKKFSDFIEHPVALITTDKEETLNDRKAIWLRNKAEVTPEEYKTFYQQLSHDSAEPAKTIHYGIEGAQEFKVLAFIPAKKPFAFRWDDREYGLRLYVQRVLIMEHCDALLPPYLRFVQGVVDSSDLPLNVSRELVQENPRLEKIRRNVVDNVLGGLAAMKNVENDKYVAFFKEFGPILKEGVGRDWDHKDKLNDLILFESANTPAGQYMTLEEYVAKMPEGQKEIFYLAGESREVLEHSPYLEAFRKRGEDVLLLTDPIDEFMIPSLYEYKGKQFRAVDQGDLLGDEAAPDVGDYAGLLAALKAKLTEVSDVRLSKRLTDSAAVLVADKGGMTAHMERLMQRMGRGDEAEPVKRVLELNGEHPAVSAVKTLYASNANDPRVEAYGRLFYEQAVLSEGSRLKDPAGFANRINELIAKSLK
ncbi:MAG: molecular chaperone HtpG [Gemmataceae bacterium]